MKCPKCTAVVDDDIDRCTFCGHYFKGSAMQQYKGDDYDPTLGYNPKTTRTVGYTEPKKARFRFRRK